MRNEYTKKHIKFLSKGYAAMGIPELTRAFNKKFGKNKTKGAIKNALSNRKITCGRSTGEIRIGTSSILNPKQIKFIKDNYPLFSQKNLTINFNKRFKTILTEQQIRSFTRNHRIRSGRTGCFEKGHVPWTFGKKGIHVSPQSEFKKGHMPANTKPIGTERIDNKDGYIHVKIEEPNPYTKSQTRFKQKHVVIWEREHGPVPKGFAVIFKDADKRNCVIENLELVSRAELLILNHYRYKNMPPEIKPTLLTLAKLEAKTFGIGKQL
jgi:hypothetical protein